MEEADRLLPEQAYADSLTPGAVRDQEGFADRVAREAQEESAAVLADLVKLRWRADQVERVLRALGMPVPPFMIALGVHGILGKDADEDLRVQAHSRIYEEERQRSEAAGDAEKATPPPDTPAPVEAPQEPQEAPAQDPQPVVAPQPPQVPGPPPEEKTLTEDIPEQLRRMPAAQGRWSTQTREAAELQLRILGVCEDGRDNFIAPEIAAVVNLDRARVAVHLRALEEAGLIKRSGRNRRAPEQTMGRAGVEYVPVRQRQQLAAAEGELQCKPEELAKVRDHMMQVKESTPSSVAKATGLDEDVVRHAFEELIRRHSLEFMGMNDVDQDVYKFCKPEPDGAVNRRKQATPEQDASSNGGSRAKGEPVPGTGKRLRGSGPHAEAVNALLDDLYDAGVTPERGDAGHFVIKTGHSRLAFSSTPGTHRSVLDTRTRLRNAGVLPKR